MHDLSASAELLALIEGHRDLVIEAYSQANDVLKLNAADNKTGLLALLQLTALEGSEFQGLPKAEEVIELLSIEQLQPNAFLKFQRCECANV